MKSNTPLAAQPACGARTIASRLAALCSPVDIFLDSQASLRPCATRLDSICQYLALPTPPSLILTHKYNKKELKVSNVHDCVSVVFLCLPLRYIQPCLSASASPAALHMACARSGCEFVLLAYAPLSASASAATAGASRSAEAEARPETQGKVDAGAHTASVFPKS